MSDSAMTNSSEVREPNAIEPRCRRVRQRASLMYVAFLLLSVLQLATPGRFPINVINGGPWLMADRIWSWYEPTVTPPHVLDILTVPIVALLWWPLLLLGIWPRFWSNSPVRKITKAWLTFAVVIYAYGFGQLIYLEYFFRF